MKNFLFFVLLLAVSLSSGYAGDGGKRPLHKKKTPPERFTFPTEYRIPERTEPAFRYLGSSNDPLTGIVLGQTDYDYGWGSGSPRRIALQSYDKVHMLVGERFSALSSPENRRAAKYYYYNGSDTLYSGYPIPKYMLSSSPGGLDVFTSGIADNYSVVVGQTPNWFGLSEGPGKASFATQTMPTTSSSASYPQITVDEMRGGLLWYIEMTLNPTGYAVLKSTDYGSSWVVVQENLLAAAGVQRYDVGSTGVPILVAGNGDLYVATTLTSKGMSAVGPLGDGAHPDSADATGYFKSTDGGSTWTWNRISVDGDHIILGLDTLYLFLENFGQIDAVVDRDNKLLIVVNGYMQKITNWADTSTATYFGVLLWSNEPGFGTWKLISSVHDVHYPEYDTYKFSGNAIGFAYPSIATTMEINDYFVIWQQPKITSAGIDTGANGFVRYCLMSAWGCGRSWAAPIKLPDSDDRLFPTMADQFTNISPYHYHVHYTFIHDTIPGCSVFGEHESALVDNMYATYYFIHPSSVRREGAPSEFLLEPNYPNPFNPATTIWFTLPQMSRVRLSVFDILGRVVAVLQDGALEAGKHKRIWQANAPSGIYFYKLEALPLDGSASRYTETKKMVLVR